jgi:hypothetical protein
LLSSSLPRFWSHWIFMRKISKTFNMLPHLYASLKHNILISSAIKSGKYFLHFRSVAGLNTILY